MRMARGLILTLAFFASTLDLLWAESDCERVVRTVTRRALMTLQSDSNEPLRLMVQIAETPTYNLNTTVGKIVHTGRGSDLIHFLYRNSIATGASLNLDRGSFLEVFGAPQNLRLLVQRPEILWIGLRWPRGKARSDQSTLDDHIEKILYGDNFSSTSLGL